MPKGTRITAEEVEQVKQWSEAGWPVDAIVRVSNRSESAVNRILRGDYDGMLTRTEPQAGEQDGRLDEINEKLVGLGSWMYGIESKLGELLAIVSDQKTQLCSIQSRVDKALAAPQQKAEAAKNAATAPKAEPEKELVHLVCGQCKMAYNKRLVKGVEQTACACGAMVPLRFMAKFDATCPSCGNRLVGKTNVCEPTIKVKCLCGDRVWMQWNKEEKLFE